MGGWGGSNPSVTQFKLSFFEDLKLIILNILGKPSEEKKRENEWHRTSLVFPPPSWANNDEKNNDKLVKTRPPTLLDERVTNHVFRCSLKYQNCIQMPWLFRSTLRYSVKYLLLKSHKPIYMGLTLWVWLNRKYLIGIASDPFVYTFSQASSGRK